MPKLRSVASEEAICRRTKSTYPTRYEVRRGEEIVATGHLSLEQPLAIGERIVIGGQAGIVRTVEPLLAERELRLVVQLTGDAIDA